MSKLQALFGMLKWKRTMKKNADMEPYTDEWWALMESSLVFLPEEQRDLLFNGVVLAGISL